MVVAYVHEAPDTTLRLKVKDQNPERPKETNSCTTNPSITTKAAQENPTEIAEEKKTRSSTSDLERQ